MRHVRYAFILLIFNSAVAVAAVVPAVREIAGSSCDAIPVRLALGMTTQIVLEQEPRVTLYVDKKHFKINSNPAAPRSLAIIPFFENSELDIFRSNKGGLPDALRLASLLDKNFRTNLFVFFDNSNQLLFQLRFVQKKNADSILKVTQTFKKECSL